MVDPAARSTAIGMLNVIAVPAAFTSPVIGTLRDQGVLELGEAISGLSLVAVLIVALLVFNAVKLLPRDFRAAQPADDGASEMNPTESG